MTGTESTDLNQTIDKCVWDNFERWFGECNFPSRNILQLKETLEEWHSHECATGNGLTYRLKLASKLS